jgi:hypothetical protein
MAPSERFILNGILNIFSSHRRARLFGDRPEALHEYTERLVPTEARQAGILLAEILDAWAGSHPIWLREIDDSQTHRAPSRAQIGKVRAGSAPAEKNRDGI